VGDAEVVNDCICWERDGHVRLPILVARINDSSRVTLDVFQQLRNVLQIVNHPSVA